MKFKDIATDKDSRLDPEFDINLNTPEFKENMDKMDKWVENQPLEKQKFVTITKITVPTEKDKEQLLRAFQYIHNLADIDTDFMAVNYIAHIYEDPDLKIH